MACFGPAGQKRRRSCVTRHVAVLATCLVKKGIYQRRVTRICSFCPGRIGELVEMPFQLTS